MHLITNICFYCVKYLICFRKCSIISTYSLNKFFNFVFFHWFFDFFFFFIKIFVFFLFFIEFSIFSFSLKFRFFFHWIFKIFVSFSLIFWIFFSLICFFYAKCHTFESRSKSEFVRFAKIAQNITATVDIETKFRKKKFRIFVAFVINCRLVVQFQQASLSPHRIKTCKKVKSQNFFLWWNSFFACKTNATQKPWKTK